MTTKLPKVSVMIPTYNQEAYITQAVESVLMQDYENIEIIVADDCSTDRTGEIVQKYLTDKRLKYVRNSKNLGRVKNYHNTLYVHTTGDWVINLDGDDYYTDKTFISRIVKTILSRKGIVCFFGGKCLPHQLKQYKNYEIGKEQYCFPGKLYLKKYSRIGQFSHLATLYRRDIAVKDGMCYTFDGVQSDFHAIIRLCIYGDVIVSKETGFQWRVHANNATNSFHDLKIKYLQGIRCQNRIMKDIGTAFSVNEKNEWLSNVKRNARKMYIMDNLRYIHKFHSLRIGLKNFYFERGYITLYIKALLATTIKIDLFK